MAHGGIGDTLKLVHGLHHLLQEFGGLFGVHRSGFQAALNLRPRDLQVERVQTMPLLGGDLLAHMPRVLPRGDEQ